MAMLSVKICGHVLTSPVVASRSDIHKSFRDEHAIPSTKKNLMLLAAADSVHWRCSKHQFKSNSSTTMVGGNSSPFVSLGALLIHSALSKIRLNMTRSELW